MLRSVRMSHCEIYMQPATAFETVAQLADLKCIQFVDRHSNDTSAIRSYTAEVCRCAELESKLQYLETQIRKEGSKIKMLEPENDPKPIHPSEMAMFEKMIDKYERDISEISENIIQLKLDVMELKEIDGILKYIGPMLDKSRDDMEELKAKFRIDPEDTCCQEQLYILSGVMERKKAILCQKMLWRLAHGNIYYRQTDKDIVLQEPCKGVVRKVAFIAACQSKELLSRLEKICIAFKAKIYPCPTDPVERAELQKKLRDRVEEIDSVLGKSRYYRIMALRAVAKQLKGWTIQVRKTLAIYHQMNMMKLDNRMNSLIANCWTRQRDIPEVQEEMNKCMRALGVIAPSVIIKTPHPAKGVVPTIQHTNKFTHGPQVLINTYGIARYREINPALFTIVGLPFLFGLMYSDMGHGIILMGIGFWLIVQEEDYKKIRGNAFWDLFFGARYIILMMGIWSFIAGFIYNQLLSRSINLGSSMYRNVLTESKLAEQTPVFMGKEARLNKPYIWGMDPVWQMSNNRFRIKNSLMMKSSLTIGTIHMLFGLGLSIFNYRYFKNYLQIYLHVLPKILIICSIFTYSVGLIYYKWFNYSAGNKNIAQSDSCAPSLFYLFANRFDPRDAWSQKWYQQNPPSCDKYLFRQQPTWEYVLNIILVLSFLLLLFGTPLYIVIYNWSTRRNIHKEIRAFRLSHMKGCKLSCAYPCGTYCEEACGERVLQWKAMIEKHSTPFAPLLTTQFISTLEFCMSVVVHVASYLRIWAMSMGHYLITDALWIIFLRNIGLSLLDLPFSTLHIVAMVFGFLLFAIFTFIVIVIIQGVCCFLHALRLHWIEFMHKFYMDEGYAFQPFSFDDIFASHMDRLQDVCSGRKRTPVVHDCLSSQPL